MSRDNRRIRCTACHRLKEVRDSVDARTYVCANCGRSSAFLVFLDDPNWRSHAACATPAGVLTMELAGDGQANAIRDAKAICQTCPVIDACLDSAICTEGGYKAADRWSVRGGLDPKQRADLNKQNRRATA